MLAKDCSTTLNHRVGGSSPSQPTGFTPELHCLKVSGLLARQFRSQSNPRQQYHRNIYANQTRSKRCQPDEMLLMEFKNLFLLESVRSIDMLRYQGSFRIHSTPVGVSRTSTFTSAKTSRIMSDKSKRFSARTTPRIARIAST